MSYKTEFQSNNADLQSILDTINAMAGGTEIETSSFVPTNSGGTTYKSKFGDNNIDLQRLLDMALALPDADTPSGTTIITFYIDMDEYQAEEGMTWAEWVESDYNTDGLTIDSISHNFDGTDPVSPNEVITNGTNYCIAIIVDDDF